MWGCAQPAPTCSRVFVLPLSAPSERTTIEPEPMSAALSISSALCHGVVDVGAGGDVWIDAKPAVICVGEVVSGSTDSPSVEFDCARVLIRIAMAAKACSAAIAAASGFPSCCSSCRARARCRTSPSRPCSPERARIEDRVSVLGPVDVVDRQLAPVRELEDVRLYREGRPFSTGSAGAPNSAGRTT